MSVLRICLLLAALNVLPALNVLAEDPAVPVSPVRGVAFPLGTLTVAGRALPMRLTLETEEPVEGQLSVWLRGSPGVRVQVPVAFGPGRQVVKLQMPVTLQTLSERQSRRFLFSEMPQVQTEELVVEWRAGIALQVPTSVRIAHPNRPPTVAGLVRQRFTGLPDALHDGTFELALLQAVDLPAEPQTYETLDVLMVADGGGNQLSDAQAAAIQTWVRTGGRLVMMADGVTVFRDVNPLLDRFDIRLGEPAAGQAPLIPLQLGDQVGDDWRQPLTVPYGFGTVTLLAFAAPGPTGDDEQLDILRALLQPPASPQGFHHDTASQPVLTAYAEIVGLQPVSRALMIGYLFLFVLLVTIGERVGLRRLRQPVWMWGTTLLLIAGFCVGARQLARVSRGFTPYRASMTIDDHDLSGGGTRTMLDGWFHAHRRAYRIEIPESAQLNLAVAGGQATLLPDREVLMIKAPTWAGTAWQTRHPHGRPAPVSGSFALADQQLQGALHLEPQAPAVLGSWAIYQGKPYHLIREGDRLVPSHIPNLRIEATANLDFLREAAGQQLFKRCQETRGAIPYLPPGEPGPDLTGDLPRPCLDASTALLILIAAEAPRSEIDSEARTTSLHVIRQLIRVNP